MSCDALPCRGPWCITRSDERAVMHYGLPCRGPWCHHSFSSERAVMHYHAVGPWCITRSERAVMHYHAMGLWCITRSERAVMHYGLPCRVPWCHHSFWWTSRDALMPYHAVLTQADASYIVFHKYICSADVWKQMASIASWCISQSRSSKMTHAQRSASFWTNVIGRSMAHYRIEQKYLNTYNKLYIFWVTL
jgi:hypothetical protein